MGQIVYVIDFGQLIKPTGRHRWINLIHKHRQNLLYPYQFRGRLQRPTLIIPAIRRVRRFPENFPITAPIPIRYH